jgi:hypothetical protein
MATLLPSSFPGDHSGAERLVYRKLRDETPADWTALHSVGLAGHRRKLWAEVDFVVVTDRGVLCLEVKGGNLHIEKGRWFAGDRELTHTPFEQAGGAGSTLRSFLRANLAEEELPMVGWGVMFPQTRFEAVSPEADRALVYDDDDRALPMHVYLDGLVSHWVRHQESFHAVAHIDANLHGRIVELLAPSFDLHATLSSRVRGVQEELVRLTEQQSQFLDGFSDCDRLVVRGGAGTGKTMLALAEAERLAAQGQQVLFVCANGRLASELARLMRTHPNVAVECAYTLATSVVNAGDAMNRIPTTSDRDVMQIDLPQVAVEALSEPGRYSALVVDEAQDLMSPMWLAFLGAMVAGGIEHGRWRVFLDPNQDLMLGRHGEAEDRLDAAADSRYRLGMNCRNTRQVATGTALLTGLERLDTLKAEGPDVEEQWFTSGAHQRDLAGSMLRDWLERGLDPSQITVLSSLPLARSGVGGLGQRDLGADIADVTRADAGREGSIAFSTIEDFKGFESDAILVTDIGDLGPGRSRYALYVAMTRACALLGLLLDRQVEEQYEELARDFGDRLREGLIRPG